MPIEAMSEILKDAKAKKYAVGCFNAINLDMIRGVIEACEELNSPVIICHAEVHFKYTPLDMIGGIMIREAQRSKVPVALLLDHGKSLETVMAAAKAGFNAVMIDGSSLDHEKNIELSSKVVEFSHKTGVEVEAELGHVTRPKSAGADGDEDDSVIDDTSLFTDPKEAAEFVEKTGVDALAVAFGTSHGLYLKKPSLDLKRLEEISSRVDVPLVMHGGSGLSDDDFRKAVKAGISKINYYTGMAKYAADEIRKCFEDKNTQVFYHNLMMRSIKAVKEDVMRAVMLFGSNNRI
jgi:fructose-bisphosphate aldolase, class II